MHNKKKGMTKIGQYILALLLTVSCLSTIPGEPVYADGTDYGLSGSVLDYENYFLIDKHGLNIIGAIENAGNLKGKVVDTDPWYENNGWFEYKITAPADGWYELILTYNPAISQTTPWTSGTNGALWEHEYILDGETYLNPFPKSVAANKKKVSNVWLTAGTHTFRIQQMRWMGLDAIEGYEFIPVADGVLEKNLRVTLGPDVPYGAHGGAHYLREDETFPLQVYSAGSSTGTLAVEVWAVDNAVESYVKSYPLTISASAAEVEQSLQISHDLPGLYKLKYKVNGSYVNATEGLLDVEFIVMDSTPVQPVGDLDDEVEKHLIHTIPVTQSPDYVSGAHDSEFGAQQRVVTADFGTYRETGDNGYLSNRINPNYIAYTLPAMESDKQYLIELDYPDNELRTFAIAIKEDDGSSLAGGVDTGGEYPVSNAIDTFAFHYYPVHDKDDADYNAPRLIIENAQAGLRAAVSEIRVYEVTGLPALPVGEDGRDFGFWYEEANNYAHMFGAKSNTREEYEKVVERWAKALKYLGANVMMPTVAVYSQAIYPSSQIDKIHSSRHIPDYFKMMANVAEKYDLKIIADFHRTSSELSIMFKGQTDPRRNWAVDKNGNYLNANNNDETYPLLNPIYPTNKEWLERWVAEFANRYKNMPAFAGISIRTMGWLNHGLNNFQSLNYGYDDYTGQQFSDYLGIADPGTPQARFATFTSAPYKQQWIDWRVAQIHGIYENLVDVARSVKPDLTLYSLVDENMVNWKKSALVEAGLKDIDLEGFKYIYGVYQYGRKSLKGSLEAAQAEWSLDRAYLTDSDFLNSFESSRAVAPWAHYLEDAGDTAKPADIGLRPGIFNNGWVTAHQAAAGRNVLEKYAIPLAKLDANLLLNGGNHYFFDQPLIREFMAEYRQLPQNKFELVNTFDDQVVVRAYSDTNTGDYYFYAVNTDTQPRSVQLTFGEEQTVTRLTTGDEIQTDENNTLTFELEAFQLMAFRSEGAEITGTANPEAPATPTDLTATAASFSKIELAWEEEADGSAVSYGIERKDPEYPGYKEIARVDASATSYLDEGLVPNREYTYRIRAYGANEDGSPYSAEASAVTQTAVDIGLIGHWKLDETSGTIAADDTGHGYNGKVVGGTWEPDQGYLDGTLSFNGNGDYVTAGMGAGSSSKLTVAFRMKADKLQFQEPISKLPGDLSGKGWAVKLRNNGDLWFRVGSEGNSVDTIAGSGYAAGSWVHVACTFENGTAKIYVNGTLKATRSGIAQTPDNTAAELTFGVYSAFKNFYYAGKLDDIRVYDVALSGQDIAALASTSTNLPAAASDLSATAASFSTINLTWTDNSTNEDGFRIERKTGTGSYEVAGTVGANATSYTDVGLVPGTQYTYRIQAFNASGNSVYTAEAAAATQTAVDVGLIGHWKLDETSGTVAADDTGHGYNGTVVGGAWEPDQGYLDGALSFNGNGDYVTAGMGAGSSSKLTVAFWMKADKLQFQEPISKLSKDAGGKGWAVKLRNNGDLWFRVGSEGNSVDTIAGSGYAAGSWVHVACTFENGTAKIYVNGTLKATRSGIAQTPDNTATELTFGVYSAFKSYYYAGKLDDIRVYDVALSGQDVAALAAMSTPEPVASAMQNSPDSLFLKVGDSQTVVSTVYDQNHNVMRGLTIDWSSDRPDIATVDGNGRISGIGEGEAEIRASYGNLSALTSVIVDATPPETTAQLAGNEGLDGWYRSSVQVKLQAADSLSGVHRTEYSLDGGQSWSEYGVPVDMDTEGRYEWTYRSINRAGNGETAKTISFGVDRSAPIIQMIEPVNGIYGDSFDLILKFAATDALSGVDPRRTLATLDGSPVTSETAIPLYTLPLGEHAFTVNAADLAGNETSVTVTFGTYADQESLQALVARFLAAKMIDNAGIANSLQKKLENGNTEAFLHEVEAQYGKHITAEAADYLLRDARFILGERQIQNR